MFPTLKQRLFADGPRPGYSQLCVEVARIKPTIFEHPEFVAYTQAVTDLFEQWKINNLPGLKGLGVGSSPKQLIETLSEEVLGIFVEARLIDKYDVYQLLMTYWTDTMQDDVYLIAQDGWKANSDLIPPQLIIQRYFAADQRHIEDLEAAKEAISRQLEEMEEEHGGEGGLLEEAKNEKGKLTRASLNARLKDIFDDPDAADERAVLIEYLRLLDQESEAGKKIREAQKALDAKVAAKYRTMSEDEVKTLVIDDKWLATLAAEVQNELNRVSQALTGRVKELAERYAAPLPRLSEDVEVLSGKVAAHLKRMGFSWQ